MRRHPFLLASSCLALACHHGHSDSSPTEENNVLGEATIGPAGGSIEVSDPNSPFRRTRLVIPAGALDAAVDVQLWRIGIEPGTLSEVNTFEVRPIDVVLRKPAAITLRVAEAYLDRVDTLFLDSCFPCGEDGARDAAMEDLLLFFEDRPGKPLEVVLPTDIDAGHRTITGEIDAFGRIFPLNPLLFIGMHQEAELVDPADAFTFEKHDELFVPVPNGSAMAFVGKGSLASFWSSSSNAIMIHGVGSNPLNFMGDDDLIPADLSRGIAPWFDNVVAYQYPSTRSIAANANHLYDVIMANKQPGFHATLIVHSMGGLLSRYLIEQSYRDPGRQSFTPTDPSLADTIDTLVTIATPHRGAGLANFAFGLILDGLPARDRPFLQGALDLGTEDGSFTARLNDAYTDNATRYLLIAGNVLLTGSDGVVSVSSALGVPLTPPEDDKEFSGDTSVSHTGLHQEAATNGVLDRIRKWLGK
ncbi:MAG: hypothetical protein U1E76_17955 [Planctomycetota bacterium]